MNTLIVIGCFVALVVALVVARVALSQNGHRRTLRRRH